MRIADKVYEDISPLFKGEIKLVEVEYVKKHDGMHLVVYIDKANGVSIDDCEYVSNLISPSLDELNPTGDDSYRLDVSSYGLDKPLKFDWQFNNYLNKMVNVKLYKKQDNLKEFSAILVNYTDKDYSFKVDEQVVTIEATNVVYITPYIEF